ncbi:MAG: hypothetical protein R2748_17195 [Bryobacterales bacterium]
MRGTWHALSHYKNASGQTEDDDGTTSWDSVEQKRAMFAEVQRWVGCFLGRLKSIREPGGGTLLDNSMILYGSSLGDSSEHDKYNNLPTLVAGRGGGGGRTGRLIDHAKPMNLANYHLAFLRRLGLDLDRFGRNLPDDDTPELELIPWQDA